MRQPVFRFQEEILTDAPFPELVERLERLQALPTWHPRFRALLIDPIVNRARVRPWLKWLNIDLKLSDKNGSITLGWELNPLRGLAEFGGITATPCADGRTQLQLAGELRGWLSIPMIGPLRLASHRTLEKLVESL